MTSKTQRKTTQNSGKVDRRKQNKGRIENLQPFKSRKENGGQLDPRINVGGRPKLLSDAYREWLASVNENDPLGRTNAQLGALAIGTEMLKGKVDAAREIRSATEGDKLRTWEDDLADLVREGKATLEDVTAEFGRDITARIAVRCGILPSQNGRVQDAIGTEARE